MLGNSNLRTVKSLPFGEVRERIAVPIRRLSFKKARKMRSISRQPSEMTRLPFAVKE